MSLKAIRKSRGLTQSQLAEMVGVEQGTISRIERGSDAVTLRVLRQVAAPLGVKPSDLIAEDRAIGEQIVIEAFRALSPDRQQGWIDMAQAARQSS